MYLYNTSLCSPASVPFLGHALIWKTWAPLKIKVFLWLAFRKRHWTGDRRRRHGLEARPECFLCDQGSETIDHILVQCPVAKEIWFHILSALGKQCPQPATTTMRWWRRLRVTFHGEQRARLDSLFALMSWELWKERNARCFRNSMASINDMLWIIRTEAERWCEAGAVGLRALAQG